MRKSNKFVWVGWSERSRIGKHASDSGNDSDKPRLSLFFSLPLYLLPRIWAALEPAALLAGDWLAGAGKWRTIDETSNTDRRSSWIRDFGFQRYDSE